MNAFVIDDRRAAVVCAHVAERTSPIRLAVRDEPDHAADSGWQFTCGQSGEDWQRAQLWALKEVLAMEPTLTPFVDCPPRLILVREDAERGWTKADSTGEDSV